MNRVKEVERINAKDVALQLKSDTTGNAGKWDVNKSWHAQYKDSAYCYVGGLPPDLSEGDAIVVFSQFGEIVDVNMPRDKETGKTRGFCFIAYEDQRSTVLAVDNFNGAKILGRTLRCDHCASYHEEQKKNPAKLPDHLSRKLSEKEVEEKQREIQRRNVELDDAAAAKAELFAQGRGTETEEEREERVLREQLVRSKEQSAAEASADHIAAVLAKRRGASQLEIAEEKRLQQGREDRKRQREEELRKLSAPPPPLPMASLSKAGVASSADDAAGLPAVSSSKWERFLSAGSGKSGGEKKKKKDIKHHRAEPEAGAEVESGSRKQAGKGITVDETNRLRESLGLKPLAR